MLVLMSNIVMIMFCFNKVNFSLVCVIFIKLKDKIEFFFCYLRKFINGDKIIKTING